MPLRSRLDPDAADGHTIAAIETLLQRAETIRDQIIQANMRLVMSIVKKFVTPQQSLDEMLSDGIYTLMGRVLRRPTVVPLPAFAARLALGERADALLAASTRVVPHELNRTGYVFRQPFFGTGIAASDR